MRLIKRILIGDIWFALFLEMVIAYVVWTRIEIADYDIKVEHINLSNNEYNYCPYCGEKLER